MRKPRVIAVSGWARQRRRQQDTSPRFEQPTHAASPRNPSDAHCSRRRHERHLHGRRPWTWTGPGLPASEPPRRTGRIGPVRPTRDFGDILADLPILIIRRGLEQGLRRSDVRRTNHVARCRSRQPWKAPEPLTASFLPPLPLPRLPFTPEGSPAGRGRCTASAVPMEGSDA